jgi:hypothetical protein
METIAKCERALQRYFSQLKARLTARDVDTLREQQQHQRQQGCSPALTELIELDRRLAIAAAECDEHERLLHQCSQIDQQLIEINRLLTRVLTAGHHSLNRMDVALKQAKQMRDQLLVDVCCEDADGGSMVSACDILQYAERIGFTSAGPPDFEHPASMFKPPNPSEQAIRSGFLFHCRPGGVPGDLSTAKIADATIKRTAAAASARRDPPKGNNANASHAFGVVGAAAGASSEALLDMEFGDD